MAKAVTNLDGPDPNATRDSLGLMWLVLVAVFGVWLAAGVVIWNFFDRLGERGQFGDMFGAVNALFSGLAMAGVIYTVYLQRNELKLQREEMSKMVGTQLRQLHISLQTLAMECDDLANVWTNEGSDDPSFKQRAYVNLILSHWEMQFAEGLLTPEQTKATLAAYFRDSRYFRIFWEKASAHRATMANAGSENAKEFHNYAKAAYEAALAPAAEQGAPPDAPKSGAPVSWFVGLHKA